MLEAQHTQLVEKIKSTRDFESIRLAHDQFITTLMAQSFLLMKPVRNADKTEFILRHTVFFFYLYPFCVLLPLLSY